MPPVLDKIEEVLSKFPEQPVPQILAELQRLAEADPQNPGPHLAMALLTSFSLYDRRDAPRHLATADRLLRQVDTGDREMAFAQTLFKAMSSEFRLLEIARPVQGTPTEQLRARAEAEKESHSAIAEMERVVRRLRNSGLAQTIYAVLRALSRANRPDGSEYKSGIASLARRQREGRSRDLAAFFLIYAYRRAREYPQALRVGQELERRQPNSPLVKRVIASCHYFMGDIDKADSYYRQALVLSPRDASLKLDYARATLRARKAAEARDLIDRSAADDPEGLLRASREVLMKDVEVLETLMRFRT